MQWPQLFKSTIKEVPACTNSAWRILEEECFRLIEKKAKLVTKETGEHYLLSSGLHTDVFYNLKRVFESGPYRERLARLMLRRMEKAVIDPEEIDVLLGPAMGAIPLIHTLQHFHELEHTRALYVERNSEGKFVLAQGFELHPDEKVLIIDDAITTFGSIRATIQAALEACSDAWIYGFGALVDRSPAHRQPPEIFATTSRYFCGIWSPQSAYPAENCPLCREGITLIKP